MSVLQQAKDAVARIRTSLDISEDNSVVLLVAYHWDEQKIINYWSFSSQAIIASLDLIPDTRVEIPCEIRQAPCGICNKDSPCQQLGCNHSICPNCIAGYAESKVLDGELNLRCPIPSCGKMAASSVLLHYLSVGANVVFNETMENHYLASKAKDKSVLAQVTEFLLAKAFVLVHMFEDILMKLWRNKISIIASLLVVSFFCNMSCVGNTYTCAWELIMIHVFANVFDVWRNIMKTMVLCLLYKLFQSQSYSIWIVSVLSFACSAYLVLKVLMGGFLGLLVRFVRTWIRR